MTPGLTETKKLDVPSTLSNVSGKSFSQVSSPYMTNLPVSFAFICASQVSCVARVDEVSDSAKLRMTSRKEGMEPVVIALILGIVIVGEVACAVKGRAAPFEMRLRGRCQSQGHAIARKGEIPLCEAKTRRVAIDKITTLISSLLPLRSFENLTSGVHPLP